MPAPENPDVPAPSRKGGAVAVAAGIFLSRIAGLVRERVMAHYLALSPAAAAFRVALKIPNVLQVLLGEGVLSAAFIPVYSRLLAEGRIEEASRVARVIATLLALIASVIAVIGVVIARPVVDLLAPGWDENTRALTATLLQITFPGTALLVLSAWCLGVLNSHRRYFLSYVSPVLWNAALIAAAVAAGSSLVKGDADIAWWMAWGALVGSAAQFLIQLPTALRLVRGFKPSVKLDDNVRTTMRTFVPALIGRGSVQISAFVDQAIASMLGTRMVAAIGLSQTLYLLPVSLFGMAISAAELPEMSSGGREQIRERLAGSLRRVVFFVTPSAIAFVTIGSSIVALLFQTGDFKGKDAELVGLILAGSAIGLLPNTIGRLFASAFYAQGDAKTPLRASLVRITLGTGLGFVIALPLREQLGYSVELAAFGLTAATGLAGWVELTLLYRWLEKPPMPWRLIAHALGASILAGAAGYGAAYVIDGLLGALVAIAVFGAVYFLAMAKQPEARAVLRRLKIVR